MEKKSKEKRSEEERNNMCIMEGQLSKYFMYRVLTGRTIHDVWMWVCGCGLVGVCVTCVVCVVCVTCVVCVVCVTCVVCVWMVETTDVTHVPMGLCALQV